MRASRQFHALCYFVRKPEESALILCEDVVPDDIAALGQPHYLSGADGSLGART